MEILDIEADIANIENDAAIYSEPNFDRRANAIDFIDFHILDRIEILQQNAKEVRQFELLEQRARKIRQSLEDIDTKLFKQLREDIRSGVPFGDIIFKYFGPDAIDEQSNEPGYDNLDNFINSLFCSSALPEATVRQEHEMVFYQQTPARIIFQLAEMAHFKPGEVFFDIGSGLGQVGMLVNLLTGAKTIGVEYEPAYCNYARNCAIELNLTGVEFINTDARKADYSHATIFFMYTPFEGEMLQQMLDILRQHAKSRIIRFFTYGPCSTTVAKQTWLKCLNGDGNHIYKLYQFTNPVLLP